MKKNRKAKPSVRKKPNRDDRRISPEAALQFLEDIRTMSDDMDEPSVAISIRIPGNILRAVKLRAKADGKKYQSLIIEYIRIALKKNL